MKVLVIGGGGREHAIVDALSRSPQVEKIYCAPGNAGIARQAECVAIRETEVERLRNFAAERGIGLTVVGPEVALAAGVVDCFRAAGLRIFGPTKAAARIESSKAQHEQCEGYESDGEKLSPHRVFTSMRSISCSALPAA